MPERKLNAPMRLPISGIYKIKGVGDVLAGRVEQGEVKPGDEVIFLPTHTAANPCTGKVFTVEMHHKRVDKAGPGDNVGMNIKGLDKNNLPRTGARRRRCAPAAPSARHRRARWPPTCSVFLTCAARCPIPQATS
jgi:translation elongation factor EF-1alpha